MKPFGFAFTLVLVAALSACTGGEQEDSDAGIGAYMDAQENELHKQLAGTGVSVVRDGPVSVRTATGESGSLMLLANRPRIIQHDFDWFTVWVDCNERGPIAFQYWVSRDSGNYEATNQNWRLADAVPDGCEMSSAGMFDRPAAQAQYDRGHLVDPNVMDNRTAAITDTYHRINMAPQARQFNRAGGAWRHTEKIVDCFRDITTLAVWGGIIYGNNDPANDYFVGSHGIKTAERWWKMIYRNDTNSYIAWIFDNLNSESVATMPQRRVTLDELKGEIEFIPYFHLAESGQNSTNEWSVTGSENLTCEGHTTASS